MTFLRIVDHLPVDGLLTPPVRFSDSLRTIPVLSLVPVMPEGYCVKCKAKKEIADAVEELMKNGRKAIKGKCPTCGVVMFKILGGKAAPKPATPPTQPPPA